MKKCETLRRNSRTSNNIVFMPYYDKQFLEKLNELSIESVAVKLGLTVKKHWALCPWHSDHNPSLRFSTNSKENFCHCFVCGKGGNPITLTMQVENCGFQEACQILAREFSIPLPNNEKPKYIKKTPPKKKVVRTEEPKKEPDAEILNWIVENVGLTKNAEDFLFEERKYKYEVIEKLRIGSVDNGQELVAALTAQFGLERCMDSGVIVKRQYGLEPFCIVPCLIIPYYDINGRIVNLQSRRLTKERNYRFNFVPGLAVTLYNLPILKDVEMDEPLYISEGITDCFGMLSAGKKAIGIPSTSLFKESDLKYLMNRLLFMYPDQDDAGAGLYDKMKEALNKVGCSLHKLSLPKGYGDYSEYYADKLANL